MPNYSKWTADRTNNGNTELIELYQDDGPLKFSELFGLLQDNREFVGWYTDLLKCSPFVAYFWEHPPLTCSSFENGEEFVIIDAPMLTSMRASAEAFRSYFVASEVVTFANLGRDATLIAPSPDGSTSGYPHLGAFLEQSTGRQITDLWQSVGRAVCDALSDKPIWLSTSGLGVAWLHIRLDSSPKYYQYLPYRNLA